MNKAAIAEKLRETQETKTKNTVRQPAAKRDKFTEENNFP